MSDAQKLSFVSIRSGDHHFCLPHTLVEEVLPIAQMELPPGAPEILEGVLVLSGKMRPVVDLAKLLDLPVSEVTKYTPLLILRDSERGMVLKVDAVLDVFASLPGGIVSLKPEDSFNGCCSGLCEVAGQQYYVLDVSRLLTEHEGQALKSFQTRVAQRAKSFQVS